MAALLGWYASSNLEDRASFVYYQTLEEFHAAGDVAGPARVHGYVAPGSIERDVPGRVVRFRVQNDPPHAGGSAANALPVVYASLETPDLFKDGAEVVVEGELGGDAAPAPLQAGQIDEVLLVMSWFRRHPEAMRRTQPLDLWRDRAAA